MRKIITLTLFLSSLLHAKEGEQVRLIHDRPIPFNLQVIQEALAMKKITLIDKNHFDGLKEANHIVIWNRPSWIKRKMLRSLPREKALLFLRDSPLHDKHLYDRKYFRHFKKIYTWNDDLVDYRRFFKFYIPALQPLAENLPSYEQRKPLTAIFSAKESKHPLNLYQARREAVEFFSLKKDFEFYGRGWNPHHFSSYQGEAGSKVETLKNYRYALCYESLHQVKGYITEKIFDCFAAGTIPIYWGASNIDATIPKECYIDRRLFSSNEELAAFLDRLGPEDYASYLKNIEEFLQSTAALKFSPRLFNTIFLEAVHFP